MSRSGPNWTKLYSAGRCKEIGLPWSEEEAIAVFSLGIPPEYVRDGILTVEDYEEAKTSDEKNGKPLERQTRGELDKLANELKVVFTPQTPDLALVRLISKAQEPKKEAKKVVKKK